MLLNTFLSVFACFVYVSDTYHSDNGACGGEACIALTLLLAVYLCS